MYGLLKPYYSGKKNWTLQPEGPCVFTVEKCVDELIKVAAWNNFIYSQICYVTTYCGKVWFFLYSQVSIKQAARLTI